MARIPIALALAALVTAAAAGAQQGAPAGPDTWWAARITFSDGPLLYESFWAKGRKLRAETTQFGHPIVTLVDEQRYVIYDALTRTGISIARSPTAIAQDARRSRPFGNEPERMIAAGAEKVGVEVLAGHEVEHYRDTNESRRNEVWVTQDEYRVPVQVLRVDRQTGSMNRIQYLDWAPGIALADDFFELGGSVKLEQLGYDQYVERSKRGPVGPAPPFYADLLHGYRE